MSQSSGSDRHATPLLRGIQSNEMSLDDKEAKLRKKVEFMNQNTTKIIDEGNETDSVDQHDNNNINISNQMMIPDIKQDDADLCESFDRHGRGSRNGKLQHGGGNNPKVVSGSVSVWHNTKKVFIT